MNGRFNETVFRSLFKIRLQTESCDAVLMQTSQRDRRSMFMIASIAFASALRQEKCRGPSIFRLASESYEMKVIRGNLDLIACENP